MNIWLIEDGEKRGPYPAFEVEARIRAGEIGDDLPGWMEGEPKWRPIGELPAFAAVFRERVEREEECRERWEQGEGPMPLPESAVAQPPPPLPPAALGQGYWWRRFLARWFDLHLFGLLWWGGMRWAGQDLAAALTNPWMVVLQMAPWFMLEAFLLHRFGTTPGKALLGLQVASRDGGRVSLNGCLHRCWRVWGIGLGFGLPIVIELCQMVNWWIARRAGRALWDSTGGIRVDASVLPVARMVGFALLFLVLLQVRGWMLMPAVLELYGDQFPWLREMMK